MIDDGLGLPNPETIYWAARGVLSPEHQVTWWLPATQQNQIANQCDGPGRCPLPWLSEKVVHHVMRRIHCTLYLDLDACEGVLSLLSRLAITILVSASFERANPLNQVVLRRRESWSHR
jgi:hypothetical protein